MVPHTSLHPAWFASGATRDERRNGPATAKGYHRRRCPGAVAAAFAFRLRVRDAQPHGGANLSAHQMKLKPGGGDNGDFDGWRGVVDTFRTLTVSAAWAGTLSNSPIALT